MPETNTAQDFKTLFESTYKDLSINPGDLVDGTVIARHRDFVMVDIGFKSEGLIPIEEFRDFDGEIKVDSGDQLKVVVEQLEDPSGMIVLSKEKADALESWDRVEGVYNENQTIQGLVVNKIKGGMLVNLGGIRAFLPASQIDLKPVKSLDKLINQKYDFKILKLNKIKGNIVLSRRAVLEVEREGQKKELLENLREGQVVKGIVKNITDYGAFIDLGGLDGLLHITDLSWGRVGHPSEVLTVGSEIDVVVMKYDADNSKVSLGYKQLKPDPWQNVMETFTPGERVSGKVVNITDYGVFVEISEGIEGLVHVSELTWNKKIKHPSKVVSLGDKVDAVILDLDPQNRRISLGVKQLESNPWDGLEERFPPGTKLKGVIRNITDFGLFLGIEGEEIDGLVHVSDLSWDKEAKHPSESFKKGDEVEAVVLSVDKANERFALGIKQLIDDPWGKVRMTYPVGTNVTGKVSEIGSRGIVVTLEEGVTASISNADLSAEGKVVAKDVFKIDQEVTAKVKKLDDKKESIALSIKAYEKAEEKEALKEFQSRQGEASVTLKDAIKS